MGFLKAYSFILDFYLKSDLERLEQMEEKRQGDREIYLLSLVTHHVATAAGALLGQTRGQQTHPHLSHGVKNPKVGPCSATFFRPSLEI